MIRTCSWRDWDLEELLAEKDQTTVSLVVPARNEQHTVGAVVTRIRETLLDTLGLLDEIVVIDSDSTDATFQTALDAGAQVYRSAEIRPDLGSHPGKGEAMWKSMFVTRGELVVFIDADLTDWDTHFVPGLLGPLLTESRVRLVKGFYERPGEAGALDGGRVTELVARPLIALHHPQLSGLVQPLAGEWAVRRELFESLRVPTGYAVELAALIDTVARYGTAALAQVDLGRRAHGHQPLLDLGAMATQVLAASLARTPGAPAATGGPVPDDATDLEVLLTQFGAATPDVGSGDHPAAGAPGHDRLRARERRVPLTERPAVADVRRTAGAANGEDR